MATYVPGSETYLPDIKPFTPDYKFLSAVLDVRQDKYNTNWQATNDVYNKVVYADMSRKDTNEQREQYVNNLTPSLEKISGMDLSLAQNAQSAKAVFAPFFEDKLIVRDIVKTANYRDQMKLAERYKNSPDADRRKLWHRDGVTALQYRMEDFINMDAQDALNAPSYNYVPEANIMALSEEILGKMKPPLKLKVDHFGVNSDGSPNTDWIVTDVNGEKLVGPALQIIRNQLQQDPRVVDSYQVKAYVASMDFGKAKQADGTFATVDEGRMAWAVETLTRVQENNVIRLTQGANDLRKLNNINVRWQNYKATNGIIPGSDEDKMLNENMSAYEKIKMQMQQDQKIATIIDTPPGDLKSTLSTAYQVLMLTNMNKDMLDAAKSYSMRDMESTFRVNPYAKMDKQYKYDMRKEATRSQNNLFRDSENDRRARKLAEDKGEVLSKEEKTKEALLRKALEKPNVERGDSKTIEFDKKGDLYKDEALDFSNKSSKLTKVQADQILSSLRQVDPMGEIVDKKGTYKWSIELDGKKVTGDMAMLEKVLYSKVPLTDEQAADEDFMAAYQPEYIYQEDIDRIHDERVELMTSVDNNGALNIIKSHTSEIINNEFSSLSTQMENTQENVNTLVMTHSNMLAAYGRSSVKTNIEAEKNNKELIGFKENGYPSIFQENESGVPIRLGKEEYADLVENLAKERKLTNYNRGYNDGNDDEYYMKEGRNVIEYFNYEEYKRPDGRIGRRQSKSSPNKKEGVKNYKISTTYYTDQFGEKVRAQDRKMSKIVNDKEVKLNYTVAKVFDSRNARADANFIYDSYNNSFKDGLNGKLSDEIGIIETGTLNSALQGLDNTVGNLTLGTLYKGDFNPNSINEGQGAVIYTQLLDQMAYSNSLGIKPNFYIGDEQDFDNDDTSPEAEAFMDMVRQDVIADMQSANKKSTRTSARGELFYAPVYGNAEDMDKSTMAYIFKPTEDYVASKNKGGSGESQWAGLKEANRRKILNGGITIMFNQKDDINPRKATDNFGNSVVAKVMGSPNQTYIKSIQDTAGNPAGNYSISRINQNSYVMNYQYSTYQEGGTYISSVPMVKEIPIIRETGGFKALNVNEDGIIVTIKQQGLFNEALKKKDKSLNSVKGK